MSKAEDYGNSVVRTGWGLTIAGTRITLYDIMDYLTEGWPPEAIRYWFNLRDEQLSDVWDYINSNLSEVEAEYLFVLKQAEDNRKYWEECNREHFAKVSAMPRKPGKEEIWAKLELQKAKLETEECGNFSRP